MSAVQEVAAAWREEFDQLDEVIPQLWESYGEQLTQYQSECALYGDAGPGQAVCVRAARRAAERAERRWQYLADLLGLSGLADRPPAPVFGPVYDEPF
jgi:hypothetical protein